MKAYPRYDDRVQPNLNGACDFTFLEDCKDPTAVNLDALEFTDVMVIPGCHDAMPKWAGKRGTGIYRKTFASTPGKKGVLKVHALGMWNQIFVDKRPIGIYDLPYGGISFEVPASASAERELIIVNDNRFDEKRLPLQHQFYDFYAYGGIYRDLEYFEVGDAYLDRVAFATEDLDTRKGTFRFHFKGTVPDTVEATLRVKDTDIEHRCSLAITDQLASLPLQLDGLDVWDVDNPAVYEALINVRFPDDTHDSIVERIAIRTVSTAENAILLNGKSIKLKGYNRHEANPLTGPVQSDQQLIQDIQLLKEMNCNFVRGSHYPQDQRFLDLCDEFGLLIWEETMGWGNGEAQLTDPAFQGAQMRQARDMVYNSINHPSVIMWGFLNEGHSHEEFSDKLYQDLATLIKDSDPSRLLTYGSCKKQRCRHYHLVDVVSNNMYPGWYWGNDDHRPVESIEELITVFMDWFAVHEAGNKPLILSEIGAGALYGFRDRHECHWSEEYQRDYLAEVIRVFAEDPRITGLAIWHFSDCRTFNNRTALTRPRGFNNKGSFDEYRRPKLAVETVKEAFAKIPG